jgi:hypothetical protein
MVETKFLQCGSPRRHAILGRGWLRRVAGGVRGLRMCRSDRARVPRRSRRVEPGRDFLEGRVSECAREANWGVAGGGEGWGETMGKGGLKKGGGCVGCK